MVVTAHEIEPFRLSPLSVIAVTFPAAQVTPVHVDVVSPLHGNAPDQLDNALPDVKAAAKATRELGGGGGGAGGGLGGGGLGGVSAAAHVAREATSSAQPSTLRPDARPPPLSEAATRTAAVERLLRSTALALAATWLRRDSTASASAEQERRRHASDAWISAARRHHATHRFPASACAGAGTASLGGLHRLRRRCRFEGRPRALADPERVKQRESATGMNAKG